MLGLLMGIKAKETTEQFLENIKTELECTDKQDKIIKEFEQGVEKIVQPKQKGFDSKGKIILALIVLGIGLILMVALKVLGLSIVTIPVAIVLIFLWVWLIKDVDEDDFGGGSTTLGLDK